MSQTQPSRLPWPLRLLAGVGVALAVLAAAEGLARLVLGAPPERPLVARIWDGGDALIADGDLLIPDFQGRYAIRPFTAAPPADTRRLVILGGSSVHGGSVRRSEEFPDHLAARLAEAVGPVEVLNLGRPALDSHVLVDVARSLEAHRVEADAALLYLGHNDLGNRTQRQMWKDRGTTRALLAIQLDAFRLTHELRRLTHRPSRDGADPRTRFPRLSDAEREAATQELRVNLRQIVSTLQGLGMRVALVPAISEVEAHGPLGVECPDALPPGTLTTEGVRMEYVPDRTDLAAVERALAEAPACASLVHLRGRLRIAAGDRGGYEDLLAARDLDPVTMRATSAIQQAVGEVARDSGATLLDLRDHFERTRGAPPPHWFVDEVHFSTFGHDAVAELLAPDVARLLERGEPAARR